MSELLVRTRASHSDVQWAVVPQIINEAIGAGAGAAQHLVEALSVHLGTGANALQWLSYCSRMPSTRTWSLFDTSAGGPLLESRRTSELVDTIRKGFRLTVTDLACVLRVQRPTVYAWLKDNSELRADNEERLHKIAELADEWFVLVPRSGGPDVLEGPSVSRNVIALLSVEALDMEGIRNALTDEARALKSASHHSKFRGDLQSRVPRRSNSHFDVETRRPLGPEIRK